MSDEVSIYTRFLTELSDEAFEQYINGLTEAELNAFYYDLEFQGRPKQQLPKGEWAYWLIRSGRGFGKTWVGSKVTNLWATQVADIALIGANIGEVQDTMIEGPSGILAMSRPDFKPTYNKTKTILVYPNGCKVSGYSGEEPESLRGPNNGKAWVDELFKMRYQNEVWDELEMTMRIGTNPQVLITSTPRPTALCRKINADKHTVVTTGSTTENYTLSERFLTNTIAKYKNTRRGRQELDGEILDDNPGALWKIQDIEGTEDNPIRVKTYFTNDKGEKVRWMDAMDRIVVAIDPAVTSNEETSDETGIVVAGRKGNQGYVFHADGMIKTPNEWAQEAVLQYKTYRADRVIGEANNGGDLIEALIRNVDTSIPYKKVTATRGKAIRAEPISALYEQRRIHHVGQFTELEDEMLTFDPALGRNQKSPNRMDALVWALTELFGDSFKTPQIIFL